MSKPEYDLVVVGAGIAGLAIAEIFSRAGHKVALVEKNQKVCQESSGAHHEWFHFGSLYSIFPSNQFMRTLVGGIDDLIAYYSGFAGMNIQVGKDGKLEFPERVGKWIRDEPIEYIVTARNDPDFSLSQFHGAVDYVKKIFFLLTWEMAIKQFIARHQRFHKFDWRSGQASEWVPRRGWLDYSRDVIFQVTELDARLDKNTHFRVPGFDRPMDSTAIIKDLLRSFLSYGGKLMAGCEVGDFTAEKGEMVQIPSQGGDVIFAKKLVLACGKNMEYFLQKSKMRVNVVASPLLVVYPNVCRQNFVRLTPFMHKTINHLCHQIEGKSYSVIGGGYFAPPDDIEAIDQSLQDLKTMAESIFPSIAKAQFAKAYVSYKVELDNPAGERNYQYQIKPIAENTYLAIPGKFSLAFSLAVTTYRQITGEEPPKKLRDYADVDVSAYMAPVQHRQYVMENFAQY